MRKIAVIFGTRPDTIKLAPVILRLREEPKLFSVVSIATAQHRHMLDQVLDVFGIHPDHDLNIMRPRQTLAALTERTIAALDPVLQSEHPDMVLVQGDTTTTFAGSLAAFYRGIPVGHVEAGLRTGDKANPFPEEINRRLTSALADLHFAPTETARRALLREHINPDRIHVTGNSVIDALNLAVRADHEFGSAAVRKAVASRRRIILLTMHRRENWGAPMEGACRAVKQIAARFGDHLFVFPVHLNPLVRETVYPILDGIPNIILIEPLDYKDFVNLMARSYLILTDSGGVQEEGPALGKPILVFRKVTERPEAVDFGTVRLVGLARERIVRETRRLLESRSAYAKMASAVNPYGDGRAAERIAGFIKKHLGLSNRRVSEFRPSRRIRKIVLALGLSLCGLFGPMRAAPDAPKHVLVVVEGNSDLNNLAMGDGRQLQQLLGHFNTSNVVIGVNQYVPGQMNGFDYTFYIGFNAVNPVPEKFTNDILQTTKPVIWMNTGFAEFSRAQRVRRQYGFEVTELDSVSIFDVVRYQGKTFTKGEPNANLVTVLNRRRARVLGTAYSNRRRVEIPYIIQAGNLMYWADSPFASATETDRYLLFADMLHDILHEQHEESHTALIRIEDVSPLDDPNKLRDVADHLSSRGIPFLVGVIPFYVDPFQGIRVSLSDKPELVDALKYMVKNGATIVLHGITHQYKGITATDFEFWDESTNRPVRDESAEWISKKVELGIQECMRNGIYPLLWETPHYTASTLLYRTIAKYFSSAMEQRLAIENYEYSQMFPYVIKKDIYGQRIYPENLGYVPLDADKNVSRRAVQDIIRGAKANLYVRDGYAACFFHSFLDLDLLDELVEGIEKLGYTFADLTEQKQWVKTKDRVILAGTQDYTITLDDQYLLEAYFDTNGELTKRIVSDVRLKGAITKHITLNPGEFYKAEPTEFHEHEATLAEKVFHRAERAVETVFQSDQDWQEARPAVLWDYHVKGAAYNDQASFVSALRSVNLRVDTIFADQNLNLARYNLLIVPYGSVDSLKDEQYDAITKFVRDGGNLVTDGKNDLAEEFGIHYVQTTQRILHVQDHLFPEEPVAWRNWELVHKFDADEVDETFCSDEQSETPLAIGKRYGKGKVLFLGARFDPSSQEGYSHYPYFVEYVRSYFRLRPVVRRNGLDFFFDPGLRQTYSIEALVKRWVGQGIRAVHVAGWHDYPKLREYREYTYDYGRLIRVAHANGILVYAWLEPPQVSQKFWNQHPEWREKNYKGEDAAPMWRYAMALTDPRCVEAATDEYRRLLLAYDFDGVNIAELYFEGGRGYEDPRVFAPMHPSAQREFRKKYGIDLVKIFDPSSLYYWRENTAVRQEVDDYRVGKLTEVYEILLKMAQDVAASKPGFQTIVTGMDSFGSPELREYYGADMSEIIRLQHKYGFILQVEDPEKLWSTDPSRYAAMGAMYQKFVSDSSRLSLDLNILSFRKKDVVTPFPTLIQTGIESYQLVRAASMGARKFTIYCEETVNPQDMMFFPYAAASHVVSSPTAAGYDFESPTSFNLKLPRTVTEISVDGAILSPFRDNEYLIPAGKHEVRFAAGAAGAFSTHALQTRIMSFTGNLEVVSYGMRSASLVYDSGPRAIVSLNAEPTGLTIDGQSVRPTVLKGNDCYSLLLPAGKHSVEIEVGGEFSYGINVTSLWSTTAIAIFGSAAVTSLFLMYLSLKVVGRKKPAARSARR